MVMQNRFRIYFCLLFINFSVHSKNVCVVVSEKTLLNTTKQGQKIKENIAAFEKKIIHALEQKRKSVAQSEQEILKLQKEFEREKSEFLKKSKKEQQRDRVMLQQKEQALAIALEELSALQDQFFSHAQQAKEINKKKYDSETSGFFNKILKQWAHVHQADVVLFSNSNLVAYAKDGLDITNLMKNSLQKEIATREKIYATKAEVKNLFSDLGLIYLDENKIDQAIKGPLDATKTSYYLQNKKLLDSYAHYMDDIHAKRRAPSCVKWVSDKVGFGVFATQDIKAGQFIQEYTGVLRLPNNNNDDLMYAWTYPAIGQHENNLCLDSKFEGNEIRFVNHSNHPNCSEITLVGHDKLFHVCYVAKFDIKSGQQILVSYGNQYWNARNYYEELS